jgi:hypothetical protein
MSEELVNQLTLNFLISKNQLNKLNKKINEDKDNVRLNDKEKYKERIQNLFEDLLNNKIPNNLIQEVRTGFDFFLDKCIYYFKISDNNESENLNDDNENLNDYIMDDIDFDKDDQDDQDDQEDNLEDDQDDQDDDLEENTKNIFKPFDNSEKKTNINIKEKYNKNYHKSEGKENIQHLPLDWFQNIRQDYKKNKIIPRKKEITYEEKKKI